ncbi:hypothetical protein K1719_004784 [Acacia pycnantha]|nr:hypothetical protein K1719_004784 [Acacia pycnantha]
MESAKEGKMVDTCGMHLIEDPGNHDQPSEPQDVNTILKELLTTVRGLGQMVQRHEEALNKGKSYEEDHSIHEDGLENTGTHNGHHSGGSHNTIVETRGKNSQEDEEVSSRNVTPFSIQKKWNPWFDLSSVAFGQATPHYGRAWCNNVKETNLTVI